MSNPDIDHLELIKQPKRKEVKTTASLMKKVQNFLS